MPATTEQTAHDSDSAADHLEGALMSQPGCAQGLATALVRHRVAISLIVTLSLALSGGASGLTPLGTGTGGSSTGGPLTWAPHAALLIMAAAALNGLIYGIYDFLIGRPGSSVHVSLVRGALLSAHASASSPSSPPGPPAPALHGPHGLHGSGREAVPWAYETTGSPPTLTPATPSLAPGLTQAQDPVGMRRMQQAEAARAQEEAQVQLMMDSIHLAQALDAQGCYGHFWRGHGQPVLAPTPTFSLSSLLCPCPSRTPHLPKSTEGTGKGRRTGEEAAGTGGMTSPLSARPTRGRNVMYLPPVIVAGVRVGGGWVDVALLQAAAGAGTPLAQYLALAASGSAWSVAGVTARLLSCAALLFSPVSALLSLLSSWLAPERPSLLPSLCLSLSLGLALPFLVLQVGGTWQTTGTVAVAVLALASGAGGSTSWGTSLRPDVPTSCAGGAGHGGRVRHALGVLAKIRGRDKAAGIPPLQHGLLRRLHSHVPPLYIGSRRALLSSLLCASLAPAVLYAASSSGTRGGGGGGEGALALSLSLGLSGGLARCTGLFLLLSSVPLLLSYLLTGVCVALLWPCARGGIEGSVWAHPTALTRVLQGLHFAALACCCAALTLLIVPEASWLSQRPGGDAYPSALQSAALCATALPLTSAALAYAGWRLAVAVHGGGGEGETEEGGTVRGAAVAWGPGAAIGTGVGGVPPQGVDPTVTAHVHALNSALAPFFPRPNPHAAAGGQRGVGGSVAAVYTPHPSSPSTWLAAWHCVSTPDLVSGTALAWALAAAGGGEGQGQGEGAGKVAAAVAVTVALVHVVALGVGSLVQALLLGRALQAQAQAQGSSVPVPDMLTAVYAGLGLVRAAPYLLPPSSSPAPAEGEGGAGGGVAAVLRLTRTLQGGEQEEGEEEWEEEEEEEVGDSDKEGQGMVRTSGAPLESRPTGTVREALPHAPLPLPPPLYSTTGTPAHGHGLGMTGAQARLTPLPSPPTPAAAPPPPAMMRSMPLLVAVRDPTGRAPFMLVPALTTSSATSSSSSSSRPGGAAGAGVGVRPFPSLEEEEEEEQEGEQAEGEQEEGNAPSLSFPVLTTTTSSTTAGAGGGTAGRGAGDEGAGGEEEVGDVDVDAALAHLRSVRAAVAAHLGTLSHGSRASLATGGPAAAESSSSTSSSTARGASGAQGQAQVAAAVVARQREPPHRRAKAGPGLGPGAIMQPRPY